MKYVYVASPYTKGDVAVNVRRNVEAADVLARSGYIPFAPLLTHFWHLLIPHPYEFWCAMDDAWVEKCDYLVRLTGESSGADKEVALAKAHGIPVYICPSEFYIEAFRAWAELHERTQPEGGEKFAELLEKIRSMPRYDCQGAEGDYGAGMEPGDGYVCYDDLEALLSSYAAPQPSTAMRNAAPSSEGVGQGDVAGSAPSWKPIETAPTGFVDVLVWNGKEIWVAHQNVYGGWTTSPEGDADGTGLYIDDARDVGLTHWMPLPGKPCTMNNGSST